jgi:hypothetical protein
MFNRFVTTNPVQITNNMDNSARRTEVNHHREGEQLYVNLGAIWELHMDVKNKSKTKHNNYIEIYTWI